MKQKLWTMTLLASLLALPTWASSPIEKTLDATFGERLEVDLEAGGDLHISGWARPEVQVVVRPGGRDRDSVRVEIDAVRTGVRVRSRVIRNHRRRSTSFQFEISERKRDRNRVIVGSGKAGSGEHRIRIRTVNGDVEIRRGST